MKKISFFLLIFSFVFSLFVPSWSQPAQAFDYSAEPGKILADYAGTIREETLRADGIHHVDTPAMIKTLKELNVNTYYYLIWHEKTDWDDLRNEFLPAANEAGIDVVVYLVPPSESKGTQKSYPYTTDYVTWADAIAQLSLQYSNVIGWAIDDFNRNLSTYTPEYMAQMKTAAKSVNPDLFFTPQMYSDSLTEDFLQTRAQYIDGLVLAFRDSPYRNTQVYSSAQYHIDNAFSKLQEYDLPLYWMVYTSQLSNTPANPSAEYVRESVQIALDNMKKGKVEGIITYVLRKDFAPQTTDDKSFDGKGYLNFFIGGGTHSKPGDYVQATQTIQIQDSDSYSLAFQTMDHGPNVFSYHKKQLLIDGEIVWEQDVSETSENLVWKPVNLDLTSYLKGKKEADLTFRFYENRGVSNFWTYVGFDSLVANGFEVENGDFEEKSSWEFSSNYPGLIGEIIFYDEQRSLHAFNYVKTSYTFYNLFYSNYSSRLDEGIRISLTSKSSQAMDSYFDEDVSDANKNLDDLSNEINTLMEKKIPVDQANDWQQVISNLKNLIK